MEQTSQKLDTLDGATTMLPAVPAIQTRIPRRTLVTRMKRRFYGRLERPEQTYCRIIEQESRHAKTILDLGCGYTAPDLARIPTTSCLKFGVDLVEDLRPDTAPGVTFLRSDVGSLPFAQDGFDLVISKSVIEHLVNPIIVWAEVARVLRPGGRFVFLTPNWFDYVSLFASLIPNRWHPRIVRLLTGRDEADTFPTCYRANTTRRIAGLCRQSGMMIDRLDLLRAHPHYLKRTSMTYVAGIAYEQTVQRLIKQSRPWILGVCHKPAA